MNATTESAESAQAVSEAADNRPCLEVEGSKVYADRSEDGVLVVRAYPAADTPVAVLVDETLVSGTTAGWKPHGRHRKPDAEPLDSGQETN
jgi:hypothetical protein